MSGNRNTAVGILAATSVYAIYGLNVVFCKDLFQAALLSPTVLFTLRTGGACLLFSLLSVFLPEEKLSWRERGLLMLASALCVVIPQYATLIGLTMSTPYDASLIATLKPVLTLLVAFAAGREKFSVPLLAGVLLTFAGALVLVMKPSGSFSTSPLGLAVLLLNGLSFAFYLVFFKEFVGRHGTVTMMKWMFLFAFLVSLPVSAGALRRIPLTALSGTMLGEMAFMIVFATFLSYFLMPVGQRNLSSTQYSLFIYVQCIVAAIAGTMLGLESLDGWKVLSSVLFVGGVALVRKG